ncbi:hypothetical protein Mapa_007847 [Marchantia paleacea]|nr:hypothetical protein Mapa_007847 [Marchantia paleacea]
MDINTYMNDGTAVSSTVETRETSPTTRRNFELKRSTSTNELLMYFQPRFRSGLALGLLW